MFENIRIVLIKTSHPGNIGSAARAMKNMGLSRLYLVTPECLPDGHSRALAAGGKDVLEQFTLVQTLQEAIEDCHIVFGSGSDLRIQPWPIVTPKEAAKIVVTEASAAKQVAIVFGRESNGMDNEEMNLCHYQIRIPGNPEYSSLNLAQAVQVMTYETRMAYLAAQGEGKVQLKNNVAPTVVELEYFYRHMESAVGALLEDDSRQLGTVFKRLRRIFNHANLDKKDTRILHGLFQKIGYLVNK
jgi:tRNA (cytidine32/uridine32-2'-O)-methyltransferase